MPLATRAQLEAVTGVTRVAELLEVAVSASATADQADAARRARLDAALRAGDRLIGQFITVPAPDQASDVLVGLAVEEALYFLAKHSPGGASASEHDAADLRRRDLAAMRKREQMPGRPEGQASHRPQIVASAGRYSTETKKRYY